ncbi:MAG: hypothetical protein ACTHQQ_22730 [Solirubrobacteraceae bacterium]
MTAALFEVSRGDSNLVTLFVLAAFAAALRRIAVAPRTQARKVRARPNAADEAVIGVAVAKEMIDRLAGHPSRFRSSAAPLIVLAVVAHSIRPAVERSLHAMRKAHRRLTAAAHKVSAAIRGLGL